MLGIGGEQVPVGRSGADPCLKAALGEHREFYPGHLPNPAGDDLPFEGVEPAMVPVGKLDERDPFGDLDDVRQRVGAIATEAECGGGGIAADMPATLAAGIGEGVFDRFHAPSLVVEERIVEDTANRQLGIVLDGVALEVFIPPVAVDEPGPVGIAPADPPAQRKPGGGSLDVERFVVFDRPDRRLEVDLRRRNLH